MKSSQDGQLQVGMPVSMPAFSAATRPAGLDLVLLTHQTEFLKNTNTGALVASLCCNSSIHVRRPVWSRVAPDEQLLGAINSQPSFLLYPGPKAQLLDVDVWQHYWQQQHVTPNTTTNTTTAIKPEPRLQLILLDATWQLAQKMFNQSAYLQQLPAIALYSTEKSVYQLRRNQQNLGWCTAESVRMLLAALGYQQAAAQLQQLFVLFNQPKQGATETASIR